MSNEPLRFGLLTPIVTRLPGTPQWEEDAGPEALGLIAATADELGFDYLTCSEHIGIPTAMAKGRGGRYYDPVATFGFLAGITKRIKFLSHVVVVPYHHPLEVAKRYGTVDAISGGRVILGCGVGSLKEEFDLIGAEFDGRGARFEDALAALRASLGVRVPSYSGTHYQFDDFVIDPCAVQKRMSIWLGGRSPRSLRRALRLGDGWDPFGLDLAALTELIASARQWPEWRDRSSTFDIALGVCSPFVMGQPALDLTVPGQVDAMKAIVESLRGAGATCINVALDSSSVEQYLEQLEIFRADVMSSFN